MQDEWSDEIALEGHSAGLAALAREGLPTAEAFTRYLADNDAELFPGGEDEIDIADVMRRSFAAQGVDLQDDELAALHPRGARRLGRRITRSPPRLMRCSRRCVRED